MKDGPEAAEGVRTASSATNGGGDNDMRSLEQRNGPTEVSLPVGGTLLGPPVDPDEGKGSPKASVNSTKVFSCSICNRCFGYKHVLQNHERTHTGEKPFECPECHKRFTRDHHLKTHMRLHTGEKPYQCSHCDRHFVQVANLRRHLRVHTGERPYACQTCESRFSDSNQLKAHMLIHRGEKPFQCPECLGRFRRRHHLIHHKCPKDLANLGKPRRGRKVKADHNHNHNDHHHHTILPPSHDEDERISDLEEEEEEDHIVDDDQCSEVDQPELSRRKAARTIRILTPQQRELFLRDKVSMQTQAIDMSLAQDTPKVTVIVPSRRFLAVEGVLDLSSSRSDSELDHIEEEEEEEVVDVEATTIDDDVYDDFRTNFRRRFSQRIANHKVEQMNGVHPPGATNGVHLNGNSNHHDDDSSDGGREEGRVAAGPLPLTKKVGPLTNGVVNGEM